MSNIPKPIHAYLQVRTEPALAFVHEPKSGSRRRTEVLICPPFGWEDICSYRSVRDWATHLAGTGHATMRIDLPGTGDSGGCPRDPDRLGAWTAAVAVAVSHLRERTGCHTLAGIGIGLGGLLLCKAISEGAVVDQVVLWGTPSRGRSLIRELRAFARLQEGQIRADADSEQPTDDLTVGGFLLTGETCRAIEEIDLAEIQPPQRSLKRALLLDRDGISADQRLLSCMSAWGAETTTADGDGYGAMTAKPHLARAPRELFAQVTEWLDASPGQSVLAGDHAIDRHADGTKPYSTPKPVTTASLSVDGTRIAESTITVDQPFGQLFGTVAAPRRRVPQGDMCAVLLNAGAIRRVGPNRMWVEAARRWAARGLPTLRLDIEGIGDADGESERFSELAELYTDGLVMQVRAALSALEAEGYGKRFIVGGLCSGACWSFQAALQDERVVAALLLNPRALFWHPSLETERELRRGVLRGSSWRKVIAGDVPTARLAEVAAKAPSAPLELTRRAFERRRARRAGDDELADAFDRLRDAGKSLVLLFSEDEPLREELERDGYMARAERWPNMAFDALPGRDHTLRPYPAQRRAHELLDAAIERLVRLPRIC